MAAPRPVYDDIGTVYARRRRPDPRVAAQIQAALDGARRVVNVGAGAGSYEPADRDVVAVEPSSVMLRQRRPGTAPVVQAVAEALPFADGTFDAALGVFTLHHWRDWRAGVAEVRRVASRAVFLTFEAALNADFWLFRDYVPATVGLRSFGAAPPVAEVADALGAAHVEVVPVPPDCVDGFGCAYWCRPEAYLDPEVRACISSFAELDPADVEPGIERLRDDLRTGAWHTRYGDLLDRPDYDAGYRLVIS